MPSIEEALKSKDFSILEQEGSNEVDITQENLDLSVFKGIDMPKKYMKYKEFLERSELTGLFNLKNDKMVQFIKEKLLRLRPRQDGADIPGWVYCYYRKYDKDMLNEGRLSHLILYKVGRTKKNPLRRISE